MNLEIAPRCRNNVRDNTSGSKNGSGGNVKRVIKHCDGDSVYSMDEFAVFVAGIPMYFFWIDSDSGGPSLARF